MLQLGSLKNSGRLRQLTHLRPLKKNDTRWSSTYDMMKRYIKLRPLLRDMPSVADFMLTPRQDRSLDTLFENLSELQSATKELQSGNLDFQHES